MEIVLIIFFLLALFCRNGPVGIAVVAMCWLAAAAFNPNVDSGVVWLLAITIGFAVPDDSFEA